ncbi:MAG: deoxyribodipyrimidine photolyase [Bacteroidetes bacterium HGW-Bacteroidetes-1]|nr:MAG: deoxyribodipyrimidine photolyase [Bacteroidetes bacterium HGW-Bacteroidetes-1]
MVNIFWFRRDLRLMDNHGLYEALINDPKVLPVFIFDSEIIDKLEDRSDSRIQFIYNQLQYLNKALLHYGSSLLVRYGKPMDVFNQLCSTYKIHTVFTNRDYEPYGINRDHQIQYFLKNQDVNFRSFKDHVIFEEAEIIKYDGKPYSVFTPYARKWKECFDRSLTTPFPSEQYLHNIYSLNHQLPSLAEIGFSQSLIKVPNPTIHLVQIQGYSDTRNTPSANGTTLVGPHLRFGTMSIRSLVLKALETSDTYLNELIWREFFMQILFHFPHTVSENFYSKYNYIEWRNNETEFQRWCEGKTGYPIVDAGMRELNATGHMHNRVRMITASFLTKHLLIDWRWGEAYFASKLLDFELSSNVGNWQWSAGTGCDASPYFRVFNPTEQMKKFDKDYNYIRNWVPEFQDFIYPQPMVDHVFARNRAVDTYKKALAKV